METKHEKQESVKGGKSMAESKKNFWLWVIIGLLVLATIFLTLKASSIGGAAEATVSTAKTIASTASSGMVGGC